jgi:hypothetical protein
MTLRGRQGHIFLARRRYFSAHGVDPGHDAHRMTYAGNSYPIADSIFRTRWTAGRAIILS